MCIIYVENFLTMWKGKNNPVVTYVILSFGYFVVQFHNN